MTTIKLTVSGAKARAEVAGLLTSGMVGISVSIAYDDSWEDLTKNLVCMCREDARDPGIVRTILNVSNTAVVAPEVMLPGRELYLGIEGYSADGKLVEPTTWAFCGRILLGANTGADPSAIPKLPIWAQLQSDVNALKTDVEALKNRPGGGSGGTVDQGGGALKGKLLSVLGDSISTYAGYIPDGYETYYTADNLSSVDDTWWKKVIDATGMELCVNNSYSGTRVAVTSWLGGYAGCLKSRNMALHDGDRIPDIILVAMGCNDFNNEIALGDYDASDGLTFDTSKFSDAYAQTLYNITKTYPTSRVYCCTCATSERNTPTDGPELNSQGKPFYEFNDLIRRLARTFNCGIIDFESCGITHENLTYYMIDGVQHPNAYGHCLMANKVIETIDPSNGTRYAGLEPVVAVEKSVVVTNVSLDQTAVSLEQWGTVQLAATVMPADATTKTVQWKSSDDSVATVVDGLVTAVGEGDAIITVTTDDGGYTAICAITVTVASLSDVQVTSITNTPGQYIDTGYVPTANTRTELDWARVSNATQSCLFGCRHFGIRSANADAGFLFSNFGSTWSTFAYESPGTRSVMGVEMNYVYKDGTQVFKNPNGNANTPPTKSALIFGCNGWGTSDDLSTFGGSYTVYGFKIYESDELVKNFVPWVDANGRACLKEIIGGTYHYDENGGTFDYVW